MISFPPFADMSLTGLYGILSWGVGCAIWSWAAKSKPFRGYRRADGKGSAQGMSVCRFAQPPAGAWNVLACFKVLEGYHQGKKYSKRFVNVEQGRT